MRRLLTSRQASKGNCATWPWHLAEEDPDLFAFTSALLAIPNRDLFARAAHRVKRVLLYHPARGGGALLAAPVARFPFRFSAMTLCEMCDVLRTPKDLLFSADEVASLTVPVVDIYSTHAWCLAPCLGASDGSVSIDGQRLFLSGKNYHEVDGGAVCHANFIINQRSAAEDLVKAVYATKEGPVAAR